VGESLEKYVLSKGIENLKAFLKEKEDKEYITDVIVHIIKGMNRNGDSPELVLQLREYIKTISDFTNDDLYAQEIQHLYSCITNNHNDEKFDAYLTRLGEIIALVEHPPIKARHIDLRFNLYLMASSKSWELIKRMSETLFN